jgi:esterase
MKLHTEWIPNTNLASTDSLAADGPGNGGYSILFLHGLLGNGRNLNTLARRVISTKNKAPVRDDDDDAAACHGGILVDLRGHGRSHRPGTANANATNASAEGSDHPGDHADPGRRRTYTFRDCVDDFDFTLRAMRADHPPGTVPPVRVVVGHSFGGRLALQYVAAQAGKAHPRHNNSDNNLVSELWLLDTVPGQANESVDQVIAAVTEMQRDQQQQLQLQQQQRPVLDRRNVVEKLTETYGMDVGIAQWLASSYNAKTGDFGFDLNLVQDIKPEFGSQDFVGLIRQILEREEDEDDHGANDDDDDDHRRRRRRMKPIQVHLVRGGKNAGWTVPILNELEGLAKEFPSTFHIHVLPKAGHWVHVDDLHGLVELFARHH